MSYKVGDKVKAGISCSGVKKGELCIVHEDVHGDLYIKPINREIDGDGCSCEGSWKPIASSLFDDLEVGDVITDNGGTKRTVLVKANKKVALTQEGGRVYWWTEQELKKNGSLAVKEVRKMTHQEIVEALGHEFEEVK